jgi:hypothetical protein
MATPLQILRQKSLKLYFETTKEKNVKKLFDIAKQLTSILGTINFRFKEEQIDQIAWFSSIYNFEEEFFYLKNKNFNERFENTLYSENKEEAFKYIKLTFELNNWNKDYLKIMKNLKFKNKSINFYEKFLIKGFKPKTDFEKACVYHLKYSVNSFSTEKYVFEEMGLNTSFFETSRMRKKFVANERIFDVFIKNNALYLELDYGNNLIKNH